MKNYIEFQDYINMLAADFTDSGHEDATDYAHEVADGSEYVIYYHSAWELVEMVRAYNSDLFYASEEFAMDTFDFKHSSLDNLITSVAYGIIYTTVLEAVIRNALTAEG